MAKDPLLQRPTAEVRLIPMLVLRVSSLLPHDRTSLNVRLKILADILRLRVILCTPNVSKLMPEIKVPTNVVFGTPVRCPENRLVYRPAEPSGR